MWLVKRFLPNLTAEPAANRENLTQNGSRWRNANGSATSDDREHAPGNTEPAPSLGKRKASEPDAGHPDASPANIQQAKRGPSSRPDKHTGLGSSSSRQLEQDAASNGGASVTGEGIADRDEDLEPAAGGNKRKAREYPLDGEGKPLGLIVTRPRLDHDSPWSPTSAGQTGLRNLSSLQFRVSKPAPSAPAVQPSGDSGKDPAQRRRVRFARAALFPGASAHRKLRTTIVENDTAPPELEEEPTGGPAPPLALAAPTTTPSTPAVAPAAGGATFAFGGSAPTSAGSSAAPSRTASIGGSAAGAATPFAPTAAAPTPFGAPTLQAQASGGFTMGGQAQPAARRVIKAKRPGRK
ncbi:hypothetical protein WJX72_000792 [[Myrmecia] bisecta]|uniref:Uncharacterized protein n=1 Tax=[Myrmecia] bisecta TaxID=41462 RepID=A0AAW1R4A0_9CHLO